MKKEVQTEDKPLSENARKLVDLIVKIIVNATYREIEGQNNTGSIRKKRKAKRSKRGSNKNQ
jgi:hypothetical protein